MKMAKKKQDDTFNLDNILFKCRDILRQARNSGSFFEHEHNIIMTSSAKITGTAFLYIFNLNPPICFRNNIYYQILFYYFFSLL